MSVEIEEAHSSLTARAVLAFRFNDANDNLLLAVKTAGFGSWRLVLERPPQYYETANVSPASVIYLIMYEKLFYLFAIIRTNASFDCNYCG